MSLALAHTWRTYFRIILGRCLFSIICSISILMYTISNLLKIWTKVNNHPIYLCQALADKLSVAQIISFPKFIHLSSLTFRRRPLELRHIVRGISSFRSCFWCVSVSTFIIRTGHSTVVCFVYNSLYE